MEASGVHFKIGFEENERADAAQLYEQAFGKKFSAAIPSRAQRVQYMADTFHPQFCFAAYESGRLVGLAGFHSREGMLTGGITYRSLLQHLGIVAGNRAAFIFSFYEHEPGDNVLIMDGIAVAESVRGRGIGTKLLELIIDLAAREKYSAVRLDVIEGNDGARRLYERLGFSVIKSQQFEYLRWLLGFGASATMLRTIVPADSHAVDRHFRP